MAQTRAPVAHYAQSSELSANRRNCCRAYDIVARANRRPAQLGLSLLLAARCRFYPAGVPERRISRRGGGMATLARALDCRKPGSIPDHVRRGRRTPARGMGTGMAAWQ